MIKEAKQWYSITDEQIGRLIRQGTYPGVGEGGVGPAPERGAAEGVLVEDRITVMSIRVLE
jgi:hypothetical protein